MGGNQLIIKYGNIPVQGQKLDRTETVSQPSVKFSKTGKLYTLIMWDPDVHHASRPAELHWLVTNIQSQNDIPNNQVVEYKSPQPPSDIHRYFFGLFEQQGRITLQPPERPNFNIDEFVKQNNLHQVNKVFMRIASDSY